MRQSVLRFASVSAGIVGFSLVLSSRSEAFPRFARAEGKPCGYCHVSPAGGGARNYRGQWYAAHKLSFAGFNDVAAAAKAHVPVGPYSQPAPLSEKAGATAPAADGAHIEGVATKQVILTRRAYTANPSPANRKAYSLALATLADAIWKYGQASPQRSGPIARGIYANALQLDPTNPVAIAGQRALPYK